MRFDGTRLTEMFIAANRDVLEWLRIGNVEPQPPRTPLVIEQVQSFGMAVGREVFETVHWSGRFHEAWVHSPCGGPVERLGRRDVKLHLCSDSRAKDPNIRQALLDRFGPGREIAQGTKKSPGPLYGVRKDLWAALAVAVTWWDTRRADN